MRSNYDCLSVQGREKSMTDECDINIMDLLPAEMQKTMKRGKQRLMIMFYLAMAMSMLIGIAIGIYIF